MLKKVLATLLGLFGVPSDSAPGESCPHCPVRYVPGANAVFLLYCQRIAELERENENRTKAWTVAESFWRHIVSTFL